jgi:hypothetical protein
LDKDYGVVNENRIKFQVKVHYRLRGMSGMPFHLLFILLSLPLVIQVQEDMDSLLKITFSKFLYLRIPLTFGPDVCIPSPLYLLQEVVCRLTRHVNINNNKT